MVESEMSRRVQADVVEFNTTATSPFLLGQESCYGPPRLLSFSTLTTTMTSESFKETTLAMASVAITETAETPSGPIPPAAAAGEQVVTPWDVQGGVGEDGKQVGIDYDKLIVQFGTRPIDAELLERFERLTGRRPHPLLRRKTFFSHR